MAKSFWFLSVVKKKKEGKKEALLHEYFVLFFLHLHVGEKDLRG
jgi:hypothetical protein